SKSVGNCSKLFDRASVEAKGERGARSALANNPYVVRWLHVEIGVVGFVDKGALICAWISGHFSSRYFLRSRSLAGRALTTYASPVAVGRSVTTTKGFRSAV